MTDIDDQLQDNLDPTKEWNEPTTDALPESPASANIKVWIKGFGVQFTMRGKIMRDLMINMQMLIDEAISKGWQPTWDKGTNVPPVASSSPTVPVTQNLGVCPKCGAPNKLSLKGKVYCSNKCWLKA